eukprot:TRINITY_DN209_c0_g1_i1.p1 TRINITY_DN209_c0_g1~~TRINITY_DN209_c0_g1_i1.p1  ORF type:complete len:351 (-),score=137.05 TRINITY_DN209_c0_g1_i1:40-1092(-)
MSSKKECPVDHSQFQSSIPTKGGGCPVDHSQFQKKPSDHNNNKPSIPTKGGGCPVDHSQFQKKPSDHNNNKPSIPTKGGGCPVDHSQFQKKPSDHNNNKPSIPTKGGGCPVDHNNIPQPSIKDDEEIDPRNLMPKNPKQRPSPGQPFDLPTYRMISSIPKTEGDKWVYPSQQMFYNAMKRKGGAIPEELGEMEEAMRLHNVINEYAWKKILEWENNLHSDCDDISLTSLRGRYNDVSLKAKIKQLFGYERPFDRHDWIINRCGTETRYILDYYDSHVINPEINATTVLDVRPAIDSVQSVIDRSKMFLFYRKKILEEEKKRLQQETDHERYTRIIQDYSKNKNNNNIKEK